MAHVRGSCSRPPSRGQMLRGGFCSSRRDASADARHARRVARARGAGVVQCARIWAGPVLGSRGRLGGRGARALGLGAVGRTHLMVLEHWQPKPRADRRLSDSLRISWCRGFAQHGEHGRGAAASTRSSTSTSSDAGASMRSASRSQWRPRARRRPQHSPRTGFSPRANGRCC